MSRQQIVDYAKTPALRGVGISRTLMLAGILALSSLSVQSETVGAGVSIATQLQEVQRGAIYGREYLTLHIGGHEVGPSTCRSNVLRMDTSGETSASRQEEIEAIAISAMLTGSTVMIMVPLDVTQCVDGKPTFTDLYKLPNSL